MTYEHPNPDDDYVESQGVTVTDVAMNMTTEREALLKAIDAIENDPRREPYGHHQHGRDRAIRRLREMLAATHNYIDYVESQGV